MGGPRRLLWSSFRDFPTPPAWTTWEVYRRSGIGQGRVTAFPDLDLGAQEPVARQVELRDDLAPELDAALGDQPARLGRRPHAERADEQGRQVDGIAGRQGHVGHLRGRLAVPDDPGE